jgi:hippurate hydrolase
VGQFWRAPKVLAIQTIVSRQIPPQDPAVVTVGSIHGGSKHNIIPDQVVLQLTTRSYSEDVRRTILAAIERTARGVALVAGVPDDRAPIVTVKETTPATYNDPRLTTRLRGAFAAELGEGNVVEAKRLMGSEDFGLFGLEGHRIPTCMFFLGASDPAKLAESLRTGTPLPTLHSSLFYPQAEPALRTGILAMTSAVIELLKP